MIIVIVIICAEVKIKWPPYAPLMALGGGGEEVHLQIFLNLGTRRDREVIITPWPCFTHAERATGIPYAGGWMGPTAGLDAEVR
jgi:hypothetical protein